MAVSAEQYGICEGFDRFYYDTVRRQSLAPSIGALALDSEQLARTEKRRRDELVDGIAEALPGVVHNTRQYSLESGRLVAQDGSDMEELLLNGFRHVARETTKNSFYTPFWPQRARHELDETRLWQQMASGEASFNTLVVWSPYSEEYCDPETVRLLQEAGQVPESKRAMLKIAHWDGGQLRVFIRSVDNSNVEIIKNASRSATGYEYKASNSTEILGERQKLSLSLAEAVELADKLVDAADVEITTCIDQPTRQGRKVNEALDTQRHVESETRIIDDLLAKGKKLALEYSTYEEYEGKWHSLLHGHTALIKERLLRQDLRQLIDVERAAGAAGSLAAAKGESFNMCGLIVSSKTANGTTEAEVFESVNSLMGKKVTCPECKEKVMPPTDKLQAGRLCCPDCKYEIDICTGRVYAKSKKTSARSTHQKKIGIYDAFAKIFSTDMARIDKSIAMKNQK